jgi:hypothetical protein
MADSSSFFGDEPADDQEYDGYGRYKLDVDGRGTKSYTRATTLAKTLDSGDGLAVWKARNLAYGVAQRPDLVARAALTPVSDKKSWREIEGQAEIVAAAGAKANLGTAFHQLHERVGEMTDDEYAAVDPDLRITYERYRAELARLGIEEILTEVTVGNTAIGTAGKVDGYARLSDGRVVVLDRKSGRVTEYPHSPACQLAIYSHADLIRLDNGNWVSPADQFGDRFDSEEGLIVDVTIGDADTAAVHVYVVDLSAGWYGALLATKVRRWRNRKDLLTPYQPEFPIKVPVPAAAMAVVAQHTPLRGLDGQLYPVVADVDGQPTKMLLNEQELTAVSDGTLGATSLAQPQWGFSAAQVEAGEHEQLAEQIRAQAQAQAQAQHTAAMERGPVVDAAQFIGEQAAQTQAAAMAELDAEETEPEHNDVTNDRNKADVEALLAQYKTKAALQSVVRKLNGPNANVARTRANLAADAVVSVNWLQYRSELLAAMPQKTAAPVITGQTNVTGEAVTAAALALPREGVVDNPFAPKPAALVEHTAPPVSPEETVLERISASQSIQDLAVCWQYASDNGIEWSARLQTAATTRQKTFS